MPVQTAQKGYEQRAGEARDTRALAESGTVRVSPAAAAARPGGECAILSEADPQVRRVLIAAAAGEEREGLALLFWNEGYEPLAVEDGPAALDVLRRGEAEAAVLDAELPGMSGMEVLRKARGNTADTPIILCTAHGSVEEAVTAMKCGANDYLVKPVPVEEVVRAVKGAVLGRRPRPEPVSRQELEARLRQTQRMAVVGKLVGAVAHDFNNLLMVISSYAETLLNTMRPDDSARGHIASIAQAAERATSLTQQLLGFSRTQAPAPVALDLNLLVRNMDKMVRRLMGEDVEVVTALDPALARAQADPAQVELVLMNLVINARDAMAQGGRLTIETASVELDEATSPRQLPVPSGSYVMLAVRDTGCGMDAQTQERMFDPFYTTKDKGKGTGLGLSIVWQSVAEAGGTIQVTSEPGRGTGVAIYLPRAVSAAEPAAPSSASLTGAARGSETVLVVEDDDGVRTLVAQILRRSGYTVLQAAYSSEAIQLAGGHEGPIHLLITDVVMPQMSGREMAQRLSRRRPDLRTLFMSGYTASMLANYGALSPDIPFLQKPFKPDALLAKVREVLEETRVET
jgi:two-component system cell cycle sensor histidine kinase/response regulator CckA